MSPKGDVDVVKDPFEPDFDTPETPVTSSPSKSLLGRRSSPVIRRGTSAATESVKTTTATTTTTGGSLNTTLQLLRVHQEMAPQQVVLQLLRLHRHPYPAHLLHRLRFFPPPQAVTMFSPRWFTNITHFEYFYFFERGDVRFCY